MWTFRNQIHAILCYMHSALLLEYITSAQTHTAHGRRHWLYLQAKQEEAQRRAAEEKKRREEAMKRKEDEAASRRSTLSPQKICLRIPTLLPSTLRGLWSQKDQTGSRGLLS